MNALEPRQPDRRALAAGGAQPSRAENVSKTLDRVDETYLAPFRAFEKLGATVREPGSPESTWGVIATFWLQRPDGGVIRSEEERAQHIALLEGRLAERPDPAQVEEAYQTLVNLRGVINHAQNRMIIALLLDAFPNARAHSPQAWMETVVKEVRVSEFSTLVVAKACNLLTRSETFAPSVGAVIDRCTLVQDFVDKAIGGVERGKAQRACYATCLEWLRATTPWSGDPAEPKPEPLRIDLELFNPKRSTAPSGGVSWV